MARGGASWRSVWGSLPLRVRAEPGAPRSLMETLAGLVAEDALRSVRIRGIPSTSSGTGSGRAGDALEEGWAGAPEDG